MSLASERTTYDFAAAVESPSLEVQVAAIIGERGDIAGLVASALQSAWAEGVVEGVLIGGSMFRETARRGNMGCLYERRDPRRHREPDYRAALAALASRETASKNLGVGEGDRA